MYRDKKKLSLVLMLVMITYVGKGCSVTYDQFYTNCQRNYNDSSQNATRSGNFDAFCSNVSLLNSLNQSWTAGVNCFADYSQSQLDSTFWGHIVMKQGLKTKSSQSSDSFTEFSSLSSDVINWRILSSVVTKVRDQGNYCSASWAFAVAAMCQVSVQLKYEEEVDLSEEFFAECSQYSSCDGGYIEYALQSAVYDNGVPLETEFPYNSSADSGICSSSDYTFVSDTLYNFYNLTDQQILKLLNRGPVVVSLSSDNWQYYESGVFECPDNSPINHAGLLVGATASEWIVKNSWGSNWGEGGFIRISRTRSKNCGIGYSVHMLHQSQMMIGYFLLLVLMIFYF